MISETQTEYGVRFCCHGKSWRPCASNHASRRCANVVMRGTRCSAMATSSSIEDSAQPIAELFANFLFLFVDCLVDLLLRLLSNDRVEVGQYRRRRNRARDLERQSIAGHLRHAGIRLERRSVDELGGQIETD